MVEKNEDVVRFYMKFLIPGFTLVCYKPRWKKRRKELFIEYHLIHIQLGTHGLEE